MRLLALAAVLLAAPSALSQGVYAVFEVEGGTARLVSATPTSTASTQPVGGSGPERARLRVLDSDRAVFEVEATGGALRGEFHGTPSADGGAAIEAHHLVAERWAFAVRLPDDRLPATGVVEVAVSSPNARTASAPLRVPVAELRGQSAARRAASTRRPLRRW